MVDSQVTLHQLLNSRRCLLRVLKQAASNRDVIKPEQHSLESQLTQFKSLIAQEQKQIIADAFVDYMRSLDVKNPLHIVKNAQFDINQNSMQSHILYFNLQVISQHIQVPIDAALCDSNNQWHLFLLKNSTGVKQNDLVEAAFTLNIFESLGVRVKDVSVCVVKRKCIDEPKNCIDLISVIKAIKEDQTAFDDELEGLKHQYLISKAKPLNTINPVLTRACFKPGRCDYFGECWPKVSDHSIFTIPHLHPDKKQALVAQNIVDINDIIELDDFNPKQKHYIDLVKNRTANIDWQSIKERLSKLAWPVYFLDFEADNPSIPSYPNTPTFAKIVFQYSCHRADNFDDLINGAVEHSHYVHCDDTDPRPSITRNLKRDMGDTGSIVVWHADFERRRLLEMAELLPDEADFLTDLTNRLWDLELVFKHDFDDYRTCGSKSLKRVYPMIQSRVTELLTKPLALNYVKPELLTALENIVSRDDHSNLIINDGEQVMAAWYLLKAEEDNRTKQTINQLMQDYCQLDTLALADILLYLMTVTKTDLSGYDAKSSSEEEA